jgi:predicted MFS family arabinose efflux permease
MLCRIPFGRLADKVGYKIPIVSAFITLALSYLAISETTSTPILILAMVIHGLGHGMRIVPEFVALGDSTVPEMKNVAMAYITTILEVGTAVGAITAGTMTIFLDTPTILKLASITALTGSFAAVLMQASGRPKPIKG